MMASKKLALIGLIAVSSIAVAGLEQWTLKMDGSVVSTRVRMVDGEAYVPVRDLAKARGQQVIKSGTTLEITDGSGANQADGYHGKIGDLVSTKYWRFKTSSFQKVDSYKVETKTSMDYSIYHALVDIDDSNVITAKDGYTLYVAKCLLKNARTEPVEFEWNSSDPLIAVADTNGENHSWIVVDIASPAFVSRPMSQGAALTFNVCFAVKSSATPQDLIFTLKSLDSKTKEVVRIKASD